jgi:Domain of unknown function (DUF4386)
MTVVQNTIATGLSLPRLKQEATVTSPKRLARIAGLLYLVVGIFGGFAVGYVSPMLYVPGDAAATAGNVLSNAGLVRIGIIADLLQATVFVFLGMTLYLLLRHVNRNVATAMVILVAIATTIMCLDKVFQFAALRVVADGAYAAAFGIAGSNALVLLLLDIHNYGFLIAQIFFGLWLAPLGYLAYRSGMFPRALGVVLIVAAVSYLMDVVAAFSSPDLAKQIHPFLIIAPAIGEIGMVVYLLVWGVRTPPAREHAPIAPSGQTTIAR